MGSPKFSINSLNKQTPRTRILQPGEFRRGTPVDGDGRSIPKPRHRSVHLKFYTLESGKFMIDTSANMSIIKEFMLKEKYFKRHEPMRITNINNEPVKVKYSVDLKIYEKLCTFQVVDDYMGFPGSGILGMNFLSELGLFVNFIERFAMVTHLKNGEPFIIENQGKVENYLEPKNAIKVKQFLGLVGYYKKFEKNFSAIAKPLTRLLKENVPFEFKQTEKLAFDKLKNCLIMTPVSVYPDWNEDFILATDSSNYAIAGILSQGPKICENKPVSYASRTLYKVEVNYLTTGKELLAIVYIYSEDHLKWLQTINH